MSEIGPELVVGVPRGWQCPVCGRVYAPFMTMCTYCGKDNVSNMEPPKPVVDWTMPITSTWQPKVELHGTGVVASYITKREEKEMLRRNGWTPVGSDDV